MGPPSSVHHGEDTAKYSIDPEVTALQTSRDGSRMRDEERYPIPVEAVANQQHTPIEYGADASLPQVSTPDHPHHHLGSGQDLYMVEDSMETSKGSPETENQEAPSTSHERVVRRKLIFGLRRRVFYCLVGTGLILVIVGAVIGALVGSSRIGGGNSGSSSSSSSSSDSGPLGANQRRIGAATMNITGSTRANIQVVYQDLDTTDLLYRLIWDDVAGAEQRLSNLSPVPRQGTPVAVTTVNATEGIQTDVFYLSENATDSTLSDVCQLTLQCAIGAANCSVSQNNIISGAAVFETSGLAATALPDGSGTRVYYKGAGKAVRVLSSNGDPSSLSTTTAWADGFVGTKSFSGSTIGVNFDSNDNTIQVVWVSGDTKELQEVTYSDSTGTNGIAATAIATSDPPGWRADAQFSSCFQPGLDQHHVFYVASTGNIWGLWRKSSNATWHTAHSSSEWGVAIGGIASVAWDSEIRLMYMTGTPPVLSMSASNGSGNGWSSVETL